MGTAVFILAPQRQSEAMGSPGMARNRRATAKQCEARQGRAAATHLGTRHRTGKAKQSVGKASQSIGMARCRPVPAGHRIASRSGGKAQISHGKAKLGLVAQRHRYAAPRTVKAQHSTA